MSTYTSEPGTRLAGRYLLVDQARAGTDWTYWKAIDETLARSVTVLTFAPGFGRVAEVVGAARAASRLNDPRFSQVFDVEDADEFAYVVLEWVAGESLLDMLADGPLDPPRAVSLVSEAAQALAAAHANGLAHLRLDPSCVHWTSRGGVKITGLGLAAALTGSAPGAPGSPGEGDDPELADARGLARLLYAALTGYWPDPLGYPGAFGSAGSPEPGGTNGPGPATLPPAPLADGVPCTPRQVSADVPTNIDALTCQALFQRPSRHGPALSTPAMFADALASVTPPVPLPTPAPVTAPVQRVSDRGYRTRVPTNPYPAADQGGRTFAEDGHRRPARRSPPGRAIVAAVIVAVLVAAGVAGWSLSHRSGHHPGSPGASGGASSGSSSPPSVAASNVLAPVSAGSFDPFGDNHDENGAEAKNAIDDNPSTFWHTDFYLNYPAFGNLKQGTGLFLDMGRTVRLSQVVVQFGAICCAHVQIEIGNADPGSSPLSAFTAVQSSSQAKGTTTFDVTSGVTGRYVLIWITYLPRLAGSANQYEALIYDVVVHGTAVSQSG